MGRDYENQERLKRRLYRRKTVYTLDKRFLMKYILCKLGIHSYMFTNSKRSLIVPFVEFSSQIGGNEEYENIRRWI
ncbi:hypothetical protein PSKAS_01550 [Peribacillus sp. N1]